MGSSLLEYPPSWLMSGGPCTPSWRDPNRPGCNVVRPMARLTIIPLTGTLHDVGLSVRGQSTALARRRGDETRMSSLSALRGRVGWLLAEAEGGLGFVLLHSTFGCPYFPPFYLTVPSVILHSLAVVSVVVVLAVALLWVARPSFCICICIARSLLQ